MRTLIISDLHLGAGRKRARLDQPQVRDALVAGVGGYDRLVLLGDIVELREQPMRDALAAAERVLPDLAAALPSGGEVIIVPGNHDHQLLGPWLARRRTQNPSPLVPETAVDWDPDEPLHKLAIMCGAGSGISVRGSYPGVWLREDVYAHHGHYLDGLTTTPGFERLAAGAMARMLKLSPGDAASPDDYERLLAPIYSWMFAISEQGAGDRELELSDDEQPAATGSAKILKLFNDSRGLSTQAMKLGLAGVTGLLEVAGLGDLSGNLAGEALRRASLSAYGQVLASLGLTPAYSVFGHTHRAGPLPGDIEAEWRTPSGVRLFNTGCWVNEVAFVGSEPGSSPYRAGFAVEIDGAAPPRVINLLDR